MENNSSSICLRDSAECKPWLWLLESWLKGEWVPIYSSSTWGVLILAILGIVAKGKGLQIQPNSHQDVWLYIRDLKFKWWSSFCFSFKSIQRGRGRVANSLQTVRKEPVRRPLERCQHTGHVLSSPYPEKKRLTFWGHEKWNTGKQKGSVLV